MHRSDPTDEATVAQVVEKLNAGHDRQRMGLCSRRPVRVHMMIPVHHRKRVQWACVGTVFTAQENLHDIT